MECQVLNANVNILTFFFPFLPLTNSEPIHKTKINLTEITLRKEPEPDAGVYAIISPEYQAYMATSLKLLKVIYWTISGLQQLLSVLASGCLASLTLQGDFVLPPPLASVRSAGCTVQR